MENSLKTALRRAKSFLILALVALAIYQTGQLWFVNLPNHNLIEYISGRFVPSVAERSSEFVRPMRVVKGAGDGRFAVLYAGLMYELPRVYFDNVMTELFANGRFLSVSATDYERILSRPVLVYEYAFTMPGRVFPLGFNQRTGAFLTGRGVTEFDSVAIWPSVYGQGVRVFFMNDGRTWEFALDGAREGFEFELLPVSTSSIHFVSAALEGYDFLPPGSFVARSGDINYPYFPVIVTNPYWPPIGATLANMRPRVAHFFDNPATINPRIAGDGVWTYSNIHTVVRYFDTGVLEYANFRPRRQNVTTSFLDDFSAAWAFIVNDPHVIDENEFFLTGFEARGEGYVFWFGYIVDNFPILMPAHWAVSSPEDILPAPIEVIVERGRVVRYRKLAFNFRTDAIHRWLELCLDEFMEGREGPLEGLVLGYRVSQRDSLLRLGWWGWYAAGEEAEYGMGES